MLHDPGTRATITRRVQSLRPDSQRHWGRMTVDQMLWHVNLSLQDCLGDHTSAPRRLPIPKFLMRWLVLNVPWPRGARTHPEMVALGHHDFERERAACLALIERVASRDLGAEWPSSASFGPMTGRHWSRFQARHLDHHLRQFGA